MKRREPSAERSPAAPQGLRAQLSRAVGGSLDAIRSVLSTNSKTVDVSKQRLSDVLWNDRTLVATHETASAPATQRDVREPEAELVPEAELFELVEADLVEPVEADLVESVEADLVEPDAMDLVEPVEANLVESVEADLVEPDAMDLVEPDAMDLVEPDAMDLVEAEIAAPDESELAPPEPDRVASSAESAGARMRAEARRSEVMRARLEATKARLATRLIAMPAGEAPVEPQVAPDVTSEVAPENAPALAPPVLLAAEPPTLPEPPAPAEAAPPAAAATSRTDEDGEDDGDEEPIRTRSMARLLASQGHRNRALKIYDALLAANGSDAELRAEADALRRAG